MLNEPQIQRYARQILLREVGGIGQERLLRACVRITRLDAGGRAAALWLARAGIGRLLIDANVSPAPAMDPAGLLLAADAGRPLDAAVRERLLFHAPELRFDGTPDVEAPLAADPAGGARVAVEIVRRLIALY